MSGSAVDELRHAEEALGPQEVARARLRRGENGVQHLAEQRSRGGWTLAASLELATLGAEAHRFGDAFDERRLPRPVVAREEGDGALEAKQLDVLHDGDGEGELRRCGIAVAQAEDEGTGAEDPLAARAHARQRNREGAPRLPNPP